jgi:hypothetical protein
VQGRAFTGAKKFERTHVRCYGENGGALPNRRYDFFDSNFSNRSR